MEKIHKFGEERICEICAKAHPTYAHPKKIDLEAQRKTYRKELEKGEPGMVEALKETQKEGMLGVDKETLKEASLKRLHGKG